MPVSAIPAVARAATNGGKSARPGTAPTLDRGRASVGGFTSRSMAPPKRPGTPSTIPSTSCVSSCAAIVHAIKPARYANGEPTVPWRMLMSSPANGTGRSRLKTGPGRVPIASGQRALYARVWISS